jgi:hypothetical protein
VALLAAVVAAVAVAYSPARLREPTMVALAVLVDEIIHMFLQLMAAPQVAVQAVRAVIARAVAVAAAVLSRAHPVAWVARAVQVLNRP